MQPGIYVFRLIDGSEVRLDVDLISKVGTFPDAWQATKGGKTIAAFRESQVMGAWLETAAKAAPDRPAMVDIG